MKSIYDKRIGAKDTMIDMTIGEYYGLVKDCLNENEYQRKHVRNSSSIYSLLKQDLIKGCIMPPIVLAYTDIIEEDDDIKYIIGIYWQIENIRWAATIIHNPRNSERM